MKKISLILPVLNEGSLIREQLQKLQAYRANGHEVLVVDGGSVDTTVQQAEGLADRCEVCAPGRSKQMNHGAALATGDIFLFLHADTSLPADADIQISRALSDNTGRWGWFDVRLSKSRFAFRVIAFMMNRRARFTSVSTGDQALFVEKELFVEIGGFPPLELMEDIAISKSLRRYGRPVRPRGLVTTSSRRWEEKGLFSTILLMWRLRFLYFIGVHPSRLRETYYPGPSMTKQSGPPDSISNHDIGGGFAHPGTRIAVFAREPLYGQVKSRLAAKIGEEEALAIYLSMLARLGELLRSARVAEWNLWVTANIHHESFVSLCNKRNIFLQKGKDLGERMAHAIQNTLQGERVSSVVLIGTDCPALTGAYLNQALTALESGVDVVLGPAEDGGYVLVGMKRPLPEIFEDIPWGTSQVMARTLEVLRANALTYSLLGTLWDVDRPEDLSRLNQLEPPMDWHRPDRAD